MSGKKRAGARALVPKAGAALTPRAAAVVEKATRPKAPPAPPKERPQAVLSARALAVSVLSRVAATDAYLNVVLDTWLDEHQPGDSRDAAFVTELCYGTTRRQLALDFALEKYLDRSLANIEDKVLAALRLGAYQLFYMRVPKHAAVADTVEALKAVGLARATGFVNAVLRKLAVLEAPPLPPPEPRVRYLSILHSHPEWLVDRWIRQFGSARAEQMLAADNDAPPVVVRVNRSRTTREELMAAFTEMGVNARPTPLSSEGIIFGGVGRIEDVYGFSEGLWQVQDEAAQLVGLYAAVPDDAKVLDVCAAPGGKACHLAQRLQVLALDLHSNKLHKILAEAKRLGVISRMTTKPMDASKPLPASLGEFHAVLVDAPCSGLGTLRRHPELRYRRTLADLPELHALQRTILEHAQARVAPGGLLIYAVCSTDPSEGADQIEMFLRSHPDFTAEPPPASAGAFPTEQGYLRTLPGPEALDGFFAARLRRMY